MFELALPLYAFQLGYAQKLVADVPDEQLAAQPVPGRGMNHAAFLLGHLAWVGDNGASMIGGQKMLPSEWTALFGMGVKPRDDRSLYPSKAELLKSLEDSHTRFSDAAAKATPEMLAQPAPERMRARFATTGHLILALLTAHEGMHMGQLSAWRRAMGFPPVTF